MDNSLMRMLKVKLPWLIGIAMRCPAPLIFENGCIFDACWTSDSRYIDIRRYGVAKIKIKIPCLFFQLTRIERSV